MSYLRSEVIMNLWQEILPNLRERGYHLATAESCTGGMIAADIVAISGSSSVFNGGVVAYHNDVKTRVLLVGEDILNSCGAVSNECVEAMLKGACLALDCECAVATSGVAGPDGGSVEKPVGLVYIGACTPDKVVVEVCFFDGDRQGIRRQAADYSAKLLMSILTN